MCKQILLLFLVLLSYEPILAQQSIADSFRFEQGVFAGVTLNYRKAELHQDQPKENSCVLYLHGGSAKGNDNIAQMAEPAIDSIYRYLKRKGIKSTFIVPQCPQESSWGGKMNAVLKALLDAETSADASRFIFGGSMGGTATLGMLSDYPAYFSGGMAVAANPMKSLETHVAQTPLYVVMGTADVIMDVETMEIFVAGIESQGGKIKLDIEEGWTHETTCEESYTEERLSWVFDLDENSATGIADPVMEANETAVVRIYGLDGAIRSKMEKGFNLVQDADGKVRKVLF